MERALAFFNSDLDKTATKRPAATEFLGDIHVSFALYGS